mmetsp:Transcript_79144/g.220004  ORF Transcript_79144/g.220004 Transcript_79144/m.220004 type:complete len:234 (+) Transcript_79144:1304-2005(+)
MRKRMVGKACAWSRSRPLQSSSGRRCTSAKRPHRRFPSCGCRVAMEFIATSDSSWRLHSAPFAKIAYWVRLATARRLASRCSRRWAKQASPGSQRRLRRPPTWRRNRILPLRSVRRRLPTPPCPRLGPRVRQPRQPRWPRKAKDPWGRTFPSMRSRRHPNRFQLKLGAPRMAPCSSVCSCAVGHALGGHTKNTTSASVATRLCAEMSGSPALRCDSLARYGMRGAFQSGTCPT